MEKNITIKRTENGRTRNKLGGWKLVYASAAGKEVRITVIKRVEYAGIRFLEVEKKLKSQAGKNALKWDCVVFATIRLRLDIRYAKIITG